MALHKVRIPPWLRKVGILALRRAILYRMVPAQSKNMDQVRMVVIFFFTLLGQRMNLILNLVVCLFN